jgi:tripartite-type tricarboxylate transporter receptor subunit TctC
MIARFSRVALVASLALAATAYAQDFPTKPVTLVMPYAAGGPGDTLARLVAQSMTATLKQQVSSRTPRARVAPSARPRWRPRSPTATRFS